MYITTVIPLMQFVADQETESVDTFADHGVGFLWGEMLTMARSIEVTPVWVPELRLGFLYTQGKLFLR